MDAFIALVYTLMIYLPGNTKGYYIRLGVAIVLFAFVFSRKVLSEKMYLLKRVSIGMIISPIIAVLPVLFYEQFSIATFLREMIRMIYCVLSINIMVRLKVSGRILYFCTLIALIPNLTIQLMEYFKIGNSVSFIQSYYLVDDVSMRHLEAAMYSGSDFRSGSIFINPNIYMIIPLLSLCVFFYKDRKKPSLLNYVFIVLAAISGLLTGSRTSLVVMVVIMACYYFKYAKGMSRVIFVFAVFFVMIKYGESLLTNSRSFQLNIDSSLGYKFQSLWWYIQGTVTKPLYWMIGGLGSSMSGVMDNEFGRIFAWYGLYGVSWYISYYKMIWYNNDGVLFYSRIVAIVCALVSLTATVLLCMPIFSVVCLFAFSTLLENEYVLE